jgi:hypothetical protein
MRISFMPRLYAHGRRAARELLFGNLASLNLDAPAGGASPDRGVAAMAEHGRVGDLEVDQDLAFQRRSWTVQRVAWFVMLALLAGAAAGLIGPGPLSTSEAGARGSPLWIEYERFARYQAPTKLRLHFGPGVAVDGAVRVHLDDGLVESVDVRSVTPEPERVEAAEDGLVLTLRVADPARPAAASIELEPNAYGTIPIRVGIVGGPAVEARAFVYP